MLEVRQMVKTGNRPHVLFFFDHGTQDVDVLAALRAMTGRMNFEVEGLFVEDTDLLAAAGRPGFEEVTIGSSMVTQLNREHVSQAVVVEAKQKQDLFERNAKLHELNHRFRIVRGRTIEILAKRARHSDLLVVGRASRAGIRVRSGHQYASVVDTHDDVLFVNEPWLSGTSVVIALGGESDQEAAVDKAIAVADDQELSLHVVVANGAEVSPSVHALHVVRVPEVNSDTLVKICSVLDARLLILTEGGVVDWKNLCASLLNNLSCSLLRLGR